jgi:hypothetical protein
VTDRDLARSNGPSVARGTLHSLVALAVLSAAGCLRPGAEATPCSANTECPDRYWCDTVHGFCVAIPASDAGVRADQRGDVGSSDASIEDALQPDRTRHWVLVDADTSPGAVHAPKLAYHAAAHAVFAYGGAENGSSAPYFDTLWSYDGSGWTAWCQGCEPGPRYGHGFVYDSAADRLLLFGGQTTDDVVRNDLWQWTVARGWQQLHPAGASPTARHGVLAAFDARRQRLVLFGGTIDGAGGCDELWGFDGSPWGAVEPLTTWPEPRFNKPQSIAYHPLLGAVVFYGGYRGSISAQFDDMWSWDGSVMQRLCAGCTGQARGGSGFAYDEVTGRLVLQGGWSSGELAGTWESNGGSFVQVDPSDPPARDSAGMASDPGRHVIVLLGGNRTFNLSELYEYVLDP